MAWSKGASLAGKLLVPVFWIAVWQLAAFLVELSVEGRGNELLLPYPLTVGKALVRLSFQEEFWKTVLHSILRILTGLMTGTITGILLAVVTCASPWCGRLLAPAIRVIRATPVTSFILLILLWTGRDMVPAIIAGLMVLPVVWSNIAQGIRSTDPKLLELAKAYRFTRFKTIKLVYLPSLWPYFSAAITTAMGLAWKSGVAAEVICLPKAAIGTRIYNSKLYLEVADLFAWTMVVIALSLLLEACLRRAVNRKGGWAQ